MRSHLVIAALFAALSLSAPAAAQDDPPLLEPTAAAAIATELSGSAALRTVRDLSRHHRMRDSVGFRAAARTIHDRLAAYGLSEVEIIALPSDGTIFYGTQRSRPAWNARFAELWEQQIDGGRWRDAVRIASWADQPISLAQDSSSGRAETELVDIGDGTSASDYEGRQVRGRLVLTSSQPEAVAELAVGRHGAAGIISWARNQRTAWWGDDESLVRWGHLDTFGAHPTFAFMVSPARARAWQERMRSGETVRLRALVDAGQEPGSYHIATGVIPGYDRSREIVFSCHLDHPSPGANDNASGCAALLEIARTFQTLVSSGRLPTPQRTIRFVWPPEIEGTIALLSARPEFVRRSLATIHLDMVGGDTETTKSILRVYGSPPSLPSFVSDVGFVMARWVNAQSLLHADGGDAAQPLIDADGSRRALQAEIGGFNQASDIEVWAEGSYRVPVIHIADWPDRYIHTQKDLPENLDPTKLRRAMFIAAASAWYLANVDQSGLPRLWQQLRAESTHRTADMFRRIQARMSVGAGDAAARNAWHHHLAHEEATFGSVERFVPVPATMAAEARRFVDGLGAAFAQGHGPVAVSAGDTVYRRTHEPRGPMNGFGYSWLEDQLSRKQLMRPALLDRSAPPGPGFAFEALNLVDGSRSVPQVHAHLEAFIAPVPVEEVAEYFRLLESLRVIERVR